MRFAAARARPFGLPTAGLSRGNDTFPLPDGSMILLTTVVGAERTGKCCGGRMDPDEAVEGSNPAAPGENAPLAAAVRWLRKSSGCGKN